ncbi:hypothetical protein NX059_009767 [Plenodomus lindquistii]|nr:hypothetical protein NX059_009767 [Plenodomus lindquistii]
MPNSDSPLSTTSSVISITTLIYAVVVTLFYYLNTLSQARYNLIAFIDALSNDQLRIRNILDTLQALDKGSTICDNSGPCRIQHDSLLTRQRALTATQSALERCNALYSVWGVYKHRLSYETTVINNSTGLVHHPFDAVSYCRWWYTRIQWWDPDVSPAVKRMLAAATLLVTAPLMILYGIALMVYSYVVRGAVYLRIRAVHTSCLMVIARRGSEMAEYTREMESIIADLRAQVLLV